MTERLATLIPEMVMLTGAAAAMLLGLSPNAGVRRATPWVAAVTLLIAAIATIAWPSSQVIAPIADYIKLVVIFIGLVLLAVVADVPERLRATIDTEQAQAAGERFNPANIMRGEFHAFVLVSLTGVMLVAGATELIWLLLALELTSLPGYVMVATSRDRAAAQEAAVKYFFLGIMSAAVFLYGFALIYGVSGSTDFAVIRQVVAEQAAAGSLHPLLITGFILAILGIAFKIAAAPMHFYAADVYQGANVSVAAFLAFVPKTSGFIAIIMLLGLIPLTQLPDAIFWLIWIMAAATMTIGNVLGLLQHNVKRVLAYSSVAHSGYMLVPLIAGVTATGGQLGSTVSAVLFYLVAYGLATVGAFAVLGCLQKQGEEAQTYDDLAGLARRHPMLGTIMLLSVLSLIGLPPLVGFLGKIYLFGAAISGTGAAVAAIVLVVLAVVNSAVSAVYYLRIAGACFFAEGREGAEVIAAPARKAGAAFAATAALVLGLGGSGLIHAAREAGSLTAPAPSPKLEVSAPVTEADDATMRDL